MSLYIIAFQNIPSICFPPTKTYIFLADKGLLPPPPLGDMSAKNVSFVGRLPLLRQAASLFCTKQKNIYKHNIFLWKQGCREISTPRIRIYQTLLCFPLQATKLVFFQIIRFLGPLPHNLSPCHISQMTFLSHLYSSCCLYWKFSASFATILSASARP